MIQTRNPSGAKPLYIALRFSPSRFTFYTVFVLVFLLSGVLTIATSYVYRMGLVSALVIPLVLLNGVKINRLVIAYALLTWVVLMSALLNGSTLREWVLFMRILGFSYLMYHVVRAAISPRNAARIMRLCIAIAAIQLPVMVTQWVMYPHLPALWKLTSSVTDYGFGTFNFKTDYAMTFFLVQIIILLLFEHSRFRLTRYRWPIIFWLSLTVLISNAQMVKLIWAVIFFSYLITHFRLKTILITGLSLTLLGTGLYLLNSHGLLIEDISTPLDRLVAQGSEDTYLSGGYSRQAAALYLVENGTAFGDGPSKYSDPISREVLRGNTGHFFTFLSEIGFIGLLVGYVIFFLIANPIQLRPLTLQIRRASLLSFFSIAALSITSQVMNDIGVMLIYCLTARYVALVSSTGPMPTIQKPLRT